MPLKPHLFLTLIAVTLSLGCFRSDGLDRGDVSGKVTIEGEPIAKGLILFTPQEGVAGPPLELQIVNGNYASTDKGVPVGSNSVSISSIVFTGGTARDDNGREYPEETNQVPVKYNEKTTLFRDVQAGKNEFDFELEAKPKKK